jgi:uncharacterized protein
MRVAVVGGGIAGLTTAWLLAESCDVTLFERDPRLGGHAHTVDIIEDGRQIAIDVGAEFFGNRQTYPRFHRLLDLLSVPIRSFSATATVYCPENGDKLVLPPWRSGFVDWSALNRRGLLNLLRFAGFSAAVGFSNEHALRRETIGQFLERKSTPDFRDQLLVPFLLGQFGMPRDAFDDCLAYDTLKYCMQAGALRLTAPRMTEVVGGTRGYVDALAATLRREGVVKGASVTRIESDRNGIVLCFDDGGRRAADHVVIAVGASDAARLCETSGLTNEARIFDNVDIFEAELVVHGDASAMPSEPKSWSVANFRACGDSAALTVWKPWKSKSVFRSWVTGMGSTYRNEYGRFRFRHPIGNSKYYRVQDAIRVLQGTKSIWFAGACVQDNDCHESAVMSALAVARRLAPGSDRTVRLGS